MNNVNHLIHLVKFMEEVINDRNAQIKYLIAEREEQGAKYKALFQEYKKLLTDSPESKIDIDESLPF